MSMHFESIQRPFTIIVLLLLLFPRCLSAEALSPAFDCTKAEREAEKLVCSDEQLALFDRELFRIYHLALANSDLDKQGEKYLRASQRGWIKGRDEVWKVKDKKRHVADAYLFRVAEILKQYPAARSADSEGISTGPFVYDCQGRRLESFFVRAEPPRAVIYLDGSLFSLSGTPSGSGAKYVGSYEDINVEFWSRGDDALLTVREGETLSCAMQVHDDREGDKQTDTELVGKNMTFPAGQVWSWQVSRYNNDTWLEPDKKERYTINFKEDGSLQMQVDCNRVLGQYSVDGQQISITLGPGTKAYCGPDSLDQSFLRDLQGAAVWFLKNGHLYLDIKYDSGTMELSR